MGIKLKAPKASRFCRILAEARSLKLDGYWEGSAYRDHPCGVIRNGIIFANKWNTNNYCYANVMTDPDSGLKHWCKSSAAYGDPYPHSNKGDELKVYSTGEWRIDGPWQKVILDTLDELENEIEEKNLAIEWNKKIKQIDDRRKRNEEIEDIRLAFSKRLAGDK